MFEGTLPNYVSTNYPIAVRSIIARHLNKQRTIFLFRDVSRGKAPLHANLTNVHHGRPLYLGMSRCTYNSRPEDMHITLSR